MSETTPPETVTGEVTLRVADETLNLKVTVRAGPTAIVDLLPLFRGVAGALVERAVDRDTAVDRTISCRAGCGACCRQGVPVAPSEARGLATLVDAMPEPRQSVIRARFDAARTTLAAAGASTLPGVLGGAEADGAFAMGRELFRGHGRLPVPR